MLKTLTKCYSRCTSL